MKNILFRNLKLLLFILLVFNCIIVFRVNIFITIAVANSLTLLLSTVLYRNHAVKLYEGFTFITDIKNNVASKLILFLLWLLVSTFSVYILSEVLRDLGLSTFNAYNTAYLIIFIMNYEVDRRWLKKHFFTIKDFEA